jgi:SAM-dependent methyltransferase
MTLEEAAALIRDAVPAPGGVWVDLGAGEGTFTRALARLLGPGAHIYAVDRDAAALRALAGRDDPTATHAGVETARVTPVVGDFTRLEAIPEIGDSALDGALLANALHFVEEPAAFLTGLGEKVRRGGRLVIVEYDDRPRSRWVPYPVSQRRLREILWSSVFSDPTIVGTRQSRFGGLLYAAFALRRD